MGVFGDIKGMFEKGKGYVFVPLASVVFMDGDRVLIIKTPEGKNRYGPDVWQLPESELFLGKTPEECLKFTLKERLNAEFSKSNLLDVITGMVERKGVLIHILMIIYQAKLTDSITSKDCEYKWAGLEEIEKMKLAGYALKIIEDIFKMRAKLEKDIDELNSVLDKGKNVEIKW